MNRQHRNSAVEVVSVALVASFIFVWGDAVSAQGFTPPAAQVEAPAVAAGTAFTYQGQLKNNGVGVNGTCDLQFSAWDEAGSGTPPTGGNQIGLTQTASAVTVTNGLFTTVIDFGAGAINGDARWLQIAVSCPAGSNAFTTLAPRQALTAAPLALALPGLYTQPNVFSPNVIGGYSGNMIWPGTVGASILGGGMFLDPNQILAGAHGSTIAGGLGNIITATDSFIGGGDRNQVTGDTATIGGGSVNLASGQYTTIGGGDSNKATISGATVGGGHYNTANHVDATIGGGYTNTVSAPYGTIPGGFGNRVSGGGYGFAAGRQAQAMHAGAFVWADSNNNGAGGVNFTSTGVDQFLIRAGGGVGIGTNAPGAQLHVSSSGNPQVQIDQPVATDYARLRFKNATANFWDIAVGTAAIDSLNFYKQNVGDVLKLLPGNGSDYLWMGNNAHLTLGGAWTNASDRNVKANFQAVDGRAVLDQVARLPISTWNYKVEDSATRHLGPMAQDFYRAFQLGADDKSITTVDEGGVALAAIQGLYQVVQAKDAQIVAQQNQINELAARLTTLEQQSRVNNPATPTDWPLALALLGVGVLLGVSLMRRSRPGNSER